MRAARPPSRPASPSVRLSWYGQTFPCQAENPASENRGADPNVVAFRPAPSISTCLTWCCLRSEICQTRVFRTRHMPVTASDVPPAEALRDNEGCSQCYCCVPWRSRDRPLCGQRRPQAFKSWENGQLFVLAREGSELARDLGDRSVTVLPCRPTGPMWEQIQVPTVLEQYAVEVYHSPLFMAPAIKACRQLITIHVIPDRFSEQPPADFLGLYRWRQKYGGMCPELAKQLRALEKENPPDAAGGRSGAGHPDPEGGGPPKPVNPRRRRRTAEKVRRRLGEDRVPERRACRALSQPGHPAVSSEAAGQRPGIHGEGDPPLA